MKASYGITFIEGITHKDEGPKYQNINQLSLS